MELHIPNYYPKFRCLAGDCPHTCCAWWEVPVDEASAAFYRTVPGALGERLRAALTTDEDGDDCFRLTGGQCPFLTNGGLCSLQLQWGEEGIPAICREHPRFTYDYGPVREAGLCASCPEAARLILAEDFVLSMEVVPDGDAAPGEDDGPDPLLLPLLSAREAALGLLRADAPLPQRLQAVLLFANDLQNALDEGEPDSLAQVSEAYAGGFPRLENVPLPPRRESLQKVLSCLGKLEVLQADWPKLLSAASAQPAPPLPPDEAGGRCAAYFLYRHWLRALNDGDLLSWCELAVVGTAVAGAMTPLIDGGFLEAFRRFCLEVEHSQPNLDALQDALWHDLTLPDLLSLAGG